MQYLPAGGRPVVLMWSKRLWRCPDPACGVTTWSEHSEVIGARSSVTERARIEISHRFGQDGGSVAELAPAYRDRMAHLMAAVRAHRQPLINDPARIEGSKRSGWTRRCGSTPGPDAAPATSPGSSTWTAPSCWNHPAHAE